MRAALFPLVLVHALSGCALLSMQPPRTTDPSQPPRCSESRGGVVVDGVFATIYGIIGLASLAGDETAVALPFIALGTAHTASAVAGNRVATRCAKAHEAHAAWLDEQAERDERITALTQAGADSEADKLVGAYGTPCYPNMTCNAGLTCEPMTKLCIESSTPAKATTETTATTPEPATTAPATATQTAAATPPQPTPTPATTPAQSAPTPPAATPRPTPTTPPDEPGDEPVRKEPPDEPDDEPGTEEPPPRPGEAPQPKPKEAAPPQPKPTPPRSTDRDRRPPPGPPSNDETWGDFWREVNR